MLRALAEQAISEPPEEILTRMREGIGSMIAASCRDRRAIWTSGGAQELTLLKQTMEALEPPPSHDPERAEPHVLQRREEQRARCESQLSELRQLLQPRKLPKTIRTLILQLPPVEPS